MTRLCRWSTLALVLLPAAAHATDAPGRGALLQILTPERGIGFNEGEVGPVGAVGRLVSDDNSAWTCAWFLDRDLVYAGPFDQEGFCAAEFDVSTLAAGTHAFRLEAMHGPTQGMMARSLYFVTNSAPEVTATAVTSCAGPGGKFEIDVAVHDLTANQAQGAVPARGDVVEVVVGLWSGGARAARYEMALTLDDNGEALDTLTIPQPHGATDGTVYSWALTLTDAEGAEGYAGARDALYVRTPAAATYYDGALSAEGWSVDFTTAASSVAWSIETGNANQTYPFFVTIPDAGSGTVTFGYSGAEQSDLAGSCAVYTADTYVCELPTAAMSEGSYQVFASTADTCSTADVLEVDLYDDERIVDNDRDGAAEDEGSTTLNDCDDHDPTIYAGNGVVDQCDSVDINCDGVWNDAAMDPNDVAGGNEDILTATESGVTTADGDGEFVIGEGNLHAPEDVDWWGFGVGEPGWGALAFRVTLDVPGTCGTAEVDWMFNLWATSEDLYNVGSPDYSAVAVLDSRFFSYLGCDDSGGTSVREWQVEVDEETNLAFWWAEISAVNWAETYCGDSGVDTYTVTVVD